MTSFRIRSCREIGKAFMSLIEEDEKLSFHLIHRCTVWEVEPRAFGRRVAALVFVASYSLTVDSDPSDIPRLPLSGILDALKNRSESELFAPLKADPEYDTLEDAREAWLISTGVTNARALYWGNLRITARELLTLLLEQIGRDCTVEDLVSKGPHSSR
ncbi:hypothetical protein [Streptomyces kanamyceticus]|uniref:Uncharacterized protein n=1 Tax=Streptomyces kanamyceticus TaxID=1967 RepID=A0A5J6G596_STRKN|nr:hypothetical protein [Streptomyces kanamyceticus]QEU90133.1 hypothetical protein CP970_03715 [Streptomyces kanamyceticus]